MMFLQIVAAFFYLQPSLIISFVPVQILALFFCLISASLVPRSLSHKISRLAYTRSKRTASPFASMEAPKEPNGEVNLKWFKKFVFLKAFLYAFTATIFATILIFLAGLLIVPFVYVRFFQLVEISYHISIFLLLISVFIYWLLISFFLHYLLKLNHIIKLTALSSAIAGFSVLALYYLLW